MKEKIKRARKILSENLYMTIATASKEGEPWITPVYFAYDKNYTLYWYSGKDTKHSQLITQNNHIAIAVFGSSGSEEGYGVYIIGIASEVSDDELPYALDVYFSRVFSNNPVEKKGVVERIEDFLGHSPLRMYKAIPRDIYISDTAQEWNGKWIDSRSKVDLLEG